MLGNLGFQCPVDPTTGAGDTDKMTPIFHGGSKQDSGKMLRYENGQAISPQNTTISAIIVLEHLDLGMRRLSTFIYRLKLESGSAISIEQIWQISRQSVGTEHDPSLRQLRVIVYENPFARKRLPSEIFRGDFDERYGPQHGKLPRLFAGKGILELEAEESRFCGKMGSPVLKSLKQKHPEGDISGTRAK